MHDIAHLDDVVIGLNLIKWRLEGELHNAETQQKAAMEAKVNAEEESSRVRLNLFEAQEKVRQLEGYLVAEWRSRRRR